MRSRFFPLGLILAAGIPCLPLLADSSTISPPKDTRGDWVVGITAFRSEGLGTEDQYLAFSLPLLVREKLSRIPRHYFQELESQAQRSAVIRKEKRRLGEELGKLRRERDALVFKALDQDQRDDQLKALETKIKQAIQSLAALNDLDPMTVELPESKPVSFKEGTEAGQLLAAPSFSALRLAEQEEVDLLIHGRVELVQGYLFVSIEALDAVQEKILYRFQDAMDRQILNQRMAEPLERLSLLVWGTGRSSLTIRPEPPDSRIFLDGEFAGAGETVMEFLLPGKKELTVSRPGYLEKRIPLELAEGESRVVEVALESSHPPERLLLSDPPGASVYLDASYAGITPLVLDAWEEPQRLLIKKGGFASFTEYTTEASPSVFSVALEQSAQDLAEVQKRRRDGFYTAFGLFALSVPLPIFFWSTASDCSLAMDKAELDGNLKESQRLRDLGLNYYYAYLGGMALSVSLFVNMAIQLAKYVGSADRKAQ